MKNFAKFIEEDEAQYALQDLTRGIDWWVAGKTDLNVRRMIAKSCKILFPDKNPLAWSGTTYRVWFEQYQADIDNWKKVKINYRDDALFTSHSTSLDAIYRLMKKYQVFDSALITKLKVSKADVLVHLPTYVEWYREQKREHPKVFSSFHMPMVDRIEREQEILIRAKSVRDSEIIGYVENRYVYMRRVADETSL